MDEIINYAKFKEASNKLINWISKSNYLKSNAVNINEYEHVIDYLTSEDAPKLSRLSWVQAVEHAGKWIVDLNKKSKDIIELKSDTEVVLDFGDGFKFVRLVGENAYKREGLLMRHCVVSYYGKEKEIYSLRDSKNNPHCTIEKDQQIKGKGNGSISPKYINYVVKFLEWTGMKVRDSEMRNLGYLVEPFPQYARHNLYKNKYYYTHTERNYPDTVIIFTDIEEAVKYKGDKICLFEGNANFRYSHIKNLGNLQSIGGSVDFRDSKITKNQIGNIKIGGIIYFGSPH